MRQTLTAANIRYVRNELGLTQAQLADVIGVHGITVCKWETDPKWRPSGLSRRILLLTLARVRATSVEECDRTGWMMKLALEIGDRDELAALRTLLVWVAR